MDIVFETAVKYNDIFYGRREDNDHYFISVMFLRTFSGG